MVANYDCEYRRRTRSTVYHRNYNNPIVKAPMKLDSDEKESISDSDSEEAEEQENMDEKDSPSQ